MIGSFPYLNPTPRRGSLLISICTTSNYRTSRWNHSMRWIRMNTSASMLPIVHDEIQGEEVWKMSVDLQDPRGSRRISLRAYDCPWLEKKQNCITYNHHAYTHHTSIRSIWIWKPLQDTMYRVDEISTS
jgi:hypothetical protein